MDGNRIIAKYTGQPITLDTLMAGQHAGDLAGRLAEEIWQAADAIGRAEIELAQIMAWIADSTSKVTAAINAEPDQRVRTVNPLGELQAHGPRFDLLIAVREERITHLRRLVRLWHALPDTAPGGHSALDGH
ncbi:hypothetical protein ACNTMW_18280 [Planosporangium sp. 12N6]|uniref:hypothetical protein n=1 Tax=Planosporangium spinosum TaxID=3402278 RepID=UPI003CE6CF28